MELKGKKLLILGATMDEYLLVQRAHELGIYVIVTDYNVDWSLSPAKYLADEVWDISWSDVDSLAVQCRTHNVDGILAGFSEFRVENQIKLCALLNKPCYLSMEQLDITRDKMKFKNCCKHYGVPVVPEYDNSFSDIEYPVIVKPVDRAGSIGITVSYSEYDLRQAYEQAQKLSPTGQVIVEKYMLNCSKFDVFYIVIDGKIYFMGTDDTIMCPPERGREILQSAWVFPSQYEKVYLAKVDASVRKMIEGIGIANGYITISAFVDNRNEFYVFETGFRLSGELSFKYIEKAYGINYLDLMLQYALIGNISDIILSDSKKSEIVTLCVNYFGYTGKVVLQKGKCEIEKYKNADYVDFLLTNRNITNNGTLLKKVGMLFIHASSWNELIMEYSDLWNVVDFFDENGHSLLYYRLSLNSLSNLK